MKQSFTSAATSINSGKLPRVYGKIQPQRGDIILDYGCGRFTDHIAAALPAGVQYLPYDPFNQPQHVNDNTRRRAQEAQRQHKPVTVICSNVLNVIDSDDAVAAVAADLMTIAQRTGGAVYVTVYAGNNSGEGHQTGPDQYQRNQPLREYLQFFPGAEIKRGMIVYRPTMGR